MAIDCQPGTIESNRERSKQPGTSQQRQAAAPRSQQRQLIVGIELLLLLHRRIRFDTLICLSLLGIGTGTSCGSVRLDTLIPLSLLVIGIGIGIGTSCENRSNQDPSNRSGNNRSNREQLKQPGTITARALQEQHQSTRIDHPPALHTNHSSFSTGANPYRLDFGPHRSAPPHTSSQPAPPAIQPNPHLQAASRYPASEDDYDHNTNRSATAIDGNSNVAHPRPPPPATSPPPVIHQLGSSYSSTCDPPSNRSSFSSTGDPPTWLLLLLLLHQRSTI
eukprot:jgi/Psemu1/21033/gm1.21033_g